MVSRVPRQLVTEIVATLDPELRDYLGLRRGSHPDMLAMSIAGFISNRATTLYRDTLARTLRARGPDAIDTSPAHLARETDASGQSVVRIVEEAFDLRTMLHGLQLAVRATVRAAPAARALAGAVLEETVNCVLEELAAEHDLEMLDTRSDDALTALVHQRLRAPDGCAATVSRRALDYARAVALEAVERAGLERLGLHELERLLGLRPLAPQPPERGARPQVLPVEAVFTGDTVPVPINHVTWALQNAIRDAILDRGWVAAPGTAIPTHQTATNKGRGAVRVSVRPPHRMTTDPDTLPALWQQVRRLDDLTSDALLVCLAHWAAQADGPLAPVWITADAILDARGVRRIRRAGDPTGWQHGHRREDRLAAGRALAQLDALWLEIVDVEVIPAVKQRPGRRLRAESRALAVLDRLLAEDDAGEEVFLAARLVPGDWARLWHAAGLRQTGQLARRALAYDPYREQPEKWLAKSFAFAFRWNARRRAPHVRLRVASLLEDAALTPDPARPQRCRDRLERALDRLRDDGVIAGWGYERDPADLPARRWLSLWTDMIVWIAPPASRPIHP
jgi:hypothetical protein